MNINTGGKMIVVSVSGGKDSTACAVLATRLHPLSDVRLIFADTGNEHEITYNYLNDLEDYLGVEIVRLKADFTKQIEQKRRTVIDKWLLKDGVTWENVESALSVLHPTGSPFLDLCLVKGRFPSSMARFCTQELKTRVVVDYILDLLTDGNSVESWLGVRRDESISRSKLDFVERAAEGYTIFRPILMWSSQETIDFVRASGVPLNPLYSQGCDRVGCMPCINVSKHELANISIRWPDVIDRISEWERLVSKGSKRSYSTFKKAGRIGGTDKDTFDLNEIRRVVEWSKTLHGGTDYNDDWDDVQQCSSSYGLCE